MSEPMWHKASALQKDAYRLKLDECLANIELRIRDAN